MPSESVEIRAPEGKLGVLLVGLGAVSTTFVAGVEAVRKGLGRPFGSLTQMGTIRLGKRTENRVPRIADFVPLQEMDNLEFAAWDLFEDSAYEAALGCGVLEPSLLDRIRPELENLKPYPAVFDRRYVKKLDGTWVKKGSSKRDLAEQLMQDIRDFKEQKKVDSLVMIWCGSTEIFCRAQEVHSSVEKFEKGFDASDESIS